MWLPCPGHNAFGLSCGGGSGLGTVHLSTSQFNRSSAELRQPDCQVGYSSMCKKNQCIPFSRWKNRKNFKKRQKGSSIGFYVSCRRGFVVASAPPAPQSGTGFEGCYVVLLVSWKRSRTYKIYGRVLAYDRPFSAGFISLLNDPIPTRNPFLPSI